MPREVTGSRDHKGQMEVAVCLLDSFSRRVCSHTTTATLEG